MLIYETKVLGTNIQLWHINYLLKIYKIVCYNSY